MKSLSHLNLNSNKSIKVFKTIDSLADLLQNSLFFAKRSNFDIDKLFSFSTCKHDIIKNIDNALTLIQPTC